MRTLIGGVGLAIFVAPSAGAQTNMPEPSGQSPIEEIVVTAQKRSENVQQVPIAVSVFTSRALQERGISDVSQLANIAPNVTLDAGSPFSGSSSVLAAYIRGIGSNDFAFNIDPGVGVYLDGVFLARTIGANQDLLDVERIEILKGPQGTLFGRNTIGGAVSIITRDPGKEFRFTGDVTTGSYGLVGIRASVDVPITDDISSSATLSVKQRRGYQRRIPFPSATTPDESFRSFGASDYRTDDRQGSDDSWATRVKLKWNNGGPLKATLSADYTKINQQATPNSLLGTTENLPQGFAGSNNIPGTALDPSGLTGFNFAGLYNFCIGSTTAEIAARGAANLCGSRGTPLNPGRVLPSLAGVNVDADPKNNRLPFDRRFITGNPDLTYANGNDFSRLETYGVSGIVDLELAPQIALKSITAYRELHWRVGTDMDGSPLDNFATSFDMNQKQFSQEIQLLGSALDDKLKFVLGAYYFNEKGNLHDYVNFAAGLLQIDGPNALSTENYAGFGQLDFRPIDLIGITVGGRYTHESKEFEGGQSDLNGFNYKLFNCTVYGDPCSSAIGFGTPSQPLRYYVTGVNRKQFNNFSPKIGAQLHPSESIMAYASWSKGYKTGGWTTRLSNPLPVAPDFGPEKATTWEVGIKSQLLDRHLQLNLAAFTTRYQDIQLNFVQGVSPTLRNAGDARIKGFELEATAAPAAGFTLTAAVGYVDAYYTSVDQEALVVPSALQAGVYRGATLPKTPHWKTSLSPRYEISLANADSLVLLADWTHTTSVWNDTERTYLIQRKRTEIVNVSATYRRGDRYEFTIGGSNLADERYLVTGGAQIADGEIYGTYSRPAEWYARVGVHF